MAAMKKSTLLMVGVFLVFSISGAQDEQRTEVISIEWNMANAESIRGMDLDILMKWDNRLYIVASFLDLWRLQEKNISFTLETHVFESPLRAEISLQGGRNGAYHSYKELEWDLFALQSAHPQRARVHRIGESLEGRNIYALKISDNVHLDEDEAEVIIIGCHHAREWISVEVPFLLGRHLLENYESDPQVRNLVDESQIWIVPLLNPDGLEYSIHFYRYWRKNRRDNGDGSYGVDLNRNYGYQWGCDNEGSSPNPYSAVFRGTAPFSEPETRAIRELFARRNFQALVSFHNYSQVILYPWGYTENPAPDAALLDQMASSMSSLIQSVSGNVYACGQAGSSLYLTNGDTTDWSYGICGIPSFTIELPPLDQLHGGFFNAEEDIQTIFAENLPAILFLIDWSIQNAVPGENPSDGSPRRHARDRMTTHKTREPHEGEENPEGRSLAQNTRKPSPASPVRIPLRTAAPPIKNIRQEKQREQSDFPEVP